MRVLLFAAGAALTLSACGGGQKNATNTTTTTTNTMATDNTMMAPGMNGMDANAAMTTNGAMGANMADPAAQNMVMQDMNTNAPDANLANGL